jgi:hypothetical protein
MKILPSATVKPFRFKIIYFTAKTLLIRNKYTFYANCYTATSDDTTNLHSQCRCTPQNRIWLRKCHKTVRAHI